MFLRKLGLSVGRLDFWNLESEMNPYELAIHYEAENLEPTGATRDDLRAAMQTVLMIQSQMTTQLNDEQREKIISALTEYTEAEQRREQTPEEAAAAGKAIFSRLNRR